MDKRVADKDGALYNLINDPDERENLYGKPEYKNIVKYLEGLTVRNRSRILFLK